MDETCWNHPIVGVHIDCQIHLHLWWSLVYLSNLDSHGVHGGNATKPSPMMLAFRAWPLSHQLWWNGEKWIHLLWHVGVTMSENATQCGFPNYFHLRSFTSDGLPHSLSAPSHISARCVRCRRGWSPTCCESLRLWLEDQQLFHVFSILDSGRFPFRKAASLEM